MIGSGGLVIGVGQVEGLLPRLGLRRTKSASMAKPLYVGWTAHSTGGSDPLADLGAQKSVSSELVFRCVVEWSA